jgi:hypothetical protein
MWPTVLPHLITSTAQPNNNRMQPTAKSVAFIDQWAWRGG